MWPAKPRELPNPGLCEKSGLVVSKLDSRLEGHGFESYPILDGNSVKAMPGSIPAPNPGSLND